MFHSITKFLAILSLALAALPALSQSVPAASGAKPASPSAPTASGPVRVDGAWIRASVAGQSGTGAFMRLTASEPLRLVGVASPAADVAEVHEMRMDGDVMRMRAVPGGLDLPAGQAVDLRPGGYHLMLMALKAPLQAGTQVPLTLVLRDARGQLRRQEIQVPVSLRAPAGAPAAAASGAAGHDHNHNHSHGHSHPHHHHK